VYFAVLCGRDKCVKESVEVIIAEFLNMLFDCIGSFGAKGHMYKSE